MPSFTIYLNRQKDADDRLAIHTRLRSEGIYQDGDKLEAVYTGTLPDGYGVDALYPMFNRGAPGFVGDDAYPQRSLSAGDVVEFDGQRWACEPLGWRSL